MRNDAGFSLVEFLVSMSLTLVVLAISLGAFGDAMSVNQTAALMGDTDLNLRVGADMISRDLIQTGEGIPIGGIPVPSGAGTLPIMRPGPPGTAYTFPTVGGSLPAVNPGAALGPAINGQQTDLLTVMYVDNTLALKDHFLDAIAGDGTSATVNAATVITNPDNGIKVGDLIMFSNGNGNAIQEVTRLGGQTIFFEPGDPLNLNQPGATQGTLALTQTGPGVYPDTTANRIMMIHYYLDNSNPQGPRLIRQVNAGAPLAVAMNIENLQLSYDLVDGTTNPTNVKTPVAPYSENEIRKVNLFLQARSDRRNTRTGLWFRNSIATQVSLRSMSFVNRY